MATIPTSPFLVIISDIHGCYYTLRRLLAKVPKGGQLVFAGDMIDRGPHSRHVIEYAIQHNIPCVTGNHEEMLQDRDLWMRNGGYETLRSYHGQIPPDHVAWIKRLPLKIELPNLLISHTGWGLSLNREQALWDRSTEFPNDGLFRVFGHTPVSRAVITHQWANIDTGAAYKQLGYGKLTAFLWPQKEVIEQDYDESPIIETKPARELILK